MLREPLVHFLVLGTALFLVQRWVAPPAAAREIVVSAAALQGMRQDFKRRTGREPSATDEAGFVDRYLDDEVLVREALGLGLDRGDIIVRRRLLQKMEFLLETSELVPEPTEAELGAFVQAHAERYATPARVSFTHVLVSTALHPTDAGAVATSLRTALEGGADPATVGDPFIRGREIRLHTQPELGAIFGPPFAAEVMQLPAGAWSAPVRSSFGWHLVRVSEQRPGAAAAVADVRERALVDWRAAQRGEVDRAARQRLRARYTIRVETRAQQEAP